MWLTQGGEMRDNKRTVYGIWYEAKGTGRRAHGNSEIYFTLCLEPSALSP